MLLAPTATNLGTHSTLREYLLWGGVPVLIMAIVVVVILVRSHLCQTPKKGEADGIQDR